MFSAKILLLIIIRIIFYYKNSGCFNEKCEKNIKESKSIHQRLNHLMIRNWGWLKGWDENDLVFWEFFVRTFGFKLLWSQF